MKLKNFNKKFNNIRIKKNKVCNRVVNNAKLLHISLLTDLCINRENIYSNSKFKFREYTIKYLHYSKSSEYQKSLGNKYNNVIMELYPYFEANLSCTRYINKKRFMEKSHKLMKLIKVKLNEKDPIKQYENFLLIDSLMDEWLEESDTFLVDLYSQLMNDFDYFKIKMNEIYGYVEKIYPNNITDVKKRVVKYLNQFNNFNISNISKQISMILEFEYLNNECDNFLEECNITVERPIYDKYGYQGLNYN